MSFATESQVIEIKQDLDPFGGIYAQIVFGVKIPTPQPPKGIYPPPPRTDLWKHVLHVFIPQESWNNQYNLWDRCRIKIESNGKLSVEKV